MNPIPQHLYEAMSDNSDSVECWAEKANFLAPSEAEHQSETSSATSALQPPSTDTAVIVGIDLPAVQNLAELSEQVVYPLISWP